MLSKTSIRSAIVLNVPKRAAGAYENKFVLALVLALALALVLVRAAESGSVAEEVVAASPPSLPPPPAAVAADLDVNGSLVVVLSDR